MADKKDVVISCPECGAGGLVIDCRASPHGFRRRYVCKENREHRWTTLEMIADRGKGMGVGQGAPIRPKRLPWQAEQLQALRNLLQTIEG